VDGAGVVAADEQEVAVVVAPEFDGGVAAGGGVGLGDAAADVERRLVHCWSRSRCYGKNATPLVGWELGVVEAGVVGSRVVVVVRR